MQSFPPLLRGTATLLALLLLVPAAVMAGGSSEPDPDSSAEITEGRLDYFEGEVSVNGEAAEIGMPVATGDLITTGPASVADVVFGGRNIFRLDEETSARLTLDTARQGVRLERGTFAAVFDELVTTGDSGDARFLLETNVTVAGVRGTTFFVRVESDESTFVCTCHGSLRMDPRAGASPFTVTNYRHEAYRFRLTEGEVVVESELDLYHTTEELNRLADRIGVTIPWGEAPPR